jgi:hypothetical protein
VGIGGMPNAVCAALLDSSVSDLGFHTEMLTDSMVDLVRAGKVRSPRAYVESAHERAGCIECARARPRSDRPLSPPYADVSRGCMRLQVSGAHKAHDVGKHVYSFALGSQGLYDAIDGDESYLCLPVEDTNMPHLIMANRNVVSINNTTQVDLSGQAASESDGMRHISGTGGQLQFVRGAYASPGGKSFICLSSTFSKGGQRKSRIVLNLTLGNTVTTPRSDIMYAPSAREPLGQPTLAATALTPQPTSTTPMCRPAVPTHDPPIGVRPRATVLHQVRRHRVWLRQPEGPVAR